MRRSDADNPSCHARLFVRVGLLCVMALGVTTSSSAAALTASIAARLAISAAASASKPGPAATPSSPRALSTRYYNGRPVVPHRVLRMRVTAYSPDERSCGAHADGITASGYSVETNGGHMVAADKRFFPFGSLLSIPGYADDTIVPVLDRGGAIKGNRLDVLYPTHGRARAWGVQYLYVTEWRYADGEPSGFQRLRR